MAEEVNTGGMFNFRHPREVPKLSEEQKKEIEDAYKRADERKTEERRKKRIYWIIGILALIILVILGFWLL